MRGQRFEYRDTSTSTLTCCTSCLCPLQFYAEEWATQQGYDLSPYKHRVVLVPAGHGIFMNSTGKPSSATGQTTGAWLSQRKGFDGCTQWSWCTCAT